MSSKENDEEALQAFEALGLCKQVADAAVALGWKTPSKIQLEAIPHAVQGRTELLSNSTRKCLLIVFRVPDVSCRNVAVGYLIAAYLNDCRTRHNRAGADRVREDGRVRHAHFAGTYLFD
jgi:hypothetical protein